MKNDDYEDLDENMSKFIPYSKPILTSENREIIIEFDPKNSPKLPPNKYDPNFNKGSIISSSSFDVECPNNLLEHFIKVTCSGPVFLFNIYFFLILYYIY
jgi:hypothetical protein